MWCLQSLLSSDLKKNPNTHPQRHPPRHQLSLARREERWKHEELNWLNRSMRSCVGEKWAQQSQLQTVPLFLTLLNDHLLQRIVFHLIQGKKKIEMDLGLQFSKTGHWIQCTFSYLNASTRFSITMGWHFSHVHPSFQYGTCTAAAREKSLTVGRIKSDEKLLQEKKNISY